MQKIARLRILHRNPLFGECLATALEQNGEVQATFVGQTDSADFASWEAEQFDVALLDLSLEAITAELIPSLRHRWGAIKILLLVPPNCSTEIGPLIAAGAHGCVLENVSLRELVTSIARVLAGDFLCSAQLVEKMFAAFAEPAWPRRSRWQARAKTADLTEREIEILSAIADGLSNKQIARRLSLSLYTVKNHVHNILQKLQVADRSEAANHLREQGWVAKKPI